MTLPVQESRMGDIFDKIELADRIAGHTQAPKDLLRLTFQKTISQIEEREDKQFDASFKEKIWRKVSKKQLQTLKNYFLLEFCEKILGTFSSAEAKEMLKEHTDSGCIRKPSYCLQIQLMDNIHHTEILESIVNKAELMKVDFIPEIINSVHEELEVSFTS